MIKKPNKMNLGTNIFYLSVLVMKIREKRSKKKNGVALTRFSKFKKKKFKSPPLKNFSKKKPLPTPFTHNSPKILNVNLFHTHYEIFPPQVLTPHSAAASFMPFRAFLVFSHYGLGSF
jgi:hypothetical protein